VLLQGSSAVALTVLLAIALATLVFWHDPYDRSSFFIVACLALSIKASATNGLDTTSRIRKGPVLVCGSIGLSGVELGVPAAKFAHRVFFPGNAHVIKRF
jgi:hypothetical protein